MNKIIYREISEDLKIVITSVSTTLETMKKSVNEFGGCIIDNNNNFICGYEWVYEELEKLGFKGV